MKRTYNPFIDNGLFVVAYHLKKDIEDISDKDIIDNIEILVEKVEQFIECKKYKSMISSAFTRNCIYMNGDDTLVNKFKSLVDNTGNDLKCTCCGEKNIKNNPTEYISKIGRSLLPLTNSNKFFNYSNNLQVVNICPICYVLSLISILNMRKRGKFLVVYTSDSEEFMYEYTNKIQSENKVDILNDAEENKKEKISVYDDIEWLLNQQNDKYDNCGYIEQLYFVNQGQDEAHNSNIVTKKSLNMIKALQRKVLTGEFKHMGLIYPMLKNTLQYVYMDYLIDYKENKLKCSNELFEIIEGEMRSMNSDILELIKKTCTRLKGINQKDEVKQLREIMNRGDFENIIIKWQENYKDQTDLDLFDGGINDWDKLCDTPQWQSIKRRMISQFIIG